MDAMMYLAVLHTRATSQVFQVSVTTFTGLVINNYI